MVFVFRNSGFDTRISEVTNSEKITCGSEGYNLFRICFVGLKVDYMLWRVSKRLLRSVICISQELFCFLMVFAILREWFGFILFLLSNTRRLIKRYARIWRVSRFCAGIFVTVAVCVTRFSVYVLSSTIVSPVQQNISRRNFTFSFFLYCWLDVLVIIVQVL